MHHQRRKKVPGQRLEIEEGKFVEDLEHDATYKYLGIEENCTFEHKNLRRKATQEYLRRLKKICRSELSAKHKITAILPNGPPCVKLWLRHYRLAAERHRQPRCQDQESTHNAQCHL